MPLSPEMLAYARECKARAAEAKVWDGKCPGCGKHINAEWKRLCEECAKLQKWAEGAKSEEESLRRETVYRSNYQRSRSAKRKSLLGVQMGVQGVVRASKEVAKQVRVEGDQVKW